VSRRAPTQRIAAALAALGLSVALAACGSQLEPDQIVNVTEPVVTDTGVAGGSDASTGLNGTGTDLAGSGGAIGADLPPAPAAPGDAAPAAGGVGGSGDPGSPGGGSGGPSGAAGAAARGSCDGFTNSTGITDTTITIGNTADVSGPAPGVFEGSQDAVRAYAEFFNATNDICGRTLVVRPYDSRTDGGATQVAYTAGCTEVFAMIGSMNSFDSAGTKETEACGLPDLRTTSITPERINCATCFGALSSNPNEFQNAVPDFIVKNYPEASQRAAMFYLNIGAAPDNAKNQVKVFTKRGMKFPIVQAVDISEFNYSPYAQQMRDANIGSVHMIGAYSHMVRMAQAMQQQGFKPDVYMIDPTVYTPDYAVSGGSAVEGTITFLSIVPFEDAASSRELQTYISWLRQLKPSASPDFFGVYGWSSAKLFTELALKLGGKLSRETLAAELAKVKNWTAGDLHAAQNVGAKHVGECNRFMQLQGGVWRPIGGTKYTCNGVSTAE
jgi:ABC-type branched-subunit amino acid transport system substrate-binding protein